MKCTKCNIEMKKGNLYKNGMMWQKNENKDLDLGDVKSFSQVIAWKCETCNKIELTTT